MKPLFLLFSLVLGATAFGSVDYFAGNLDLTDTASGKKESILVLYERAISPEKVQIVETSTSVLAGKRYRQTYFYDHKKKTLSTYDENDKLASRTKFDCDGTFPKITACRYELTTDFYTKGRDDYHDKAIEFDAMVRDLKRGITYTTKGQIPAVPETQYRKLLLEAETKFPLVPSASLTAAE